MNSTTTTFLRHEPCPKCKSRDNLGVWSDGHKFCFGCGYYEFGSGEALKTRVKKFQTLKSSTDTTEDLHIQLPSDASTNITPVFRNWLQGYYIYSTLIDRYRLKESPRHGIILPIYDENQKLIFFQTRTFNPDYKGPKYLSFGKLGNFIPVFSSGDAADKVSYESVVIVEDYLSAMRVGKFSATVPLFGSHLHRHLVIRLSQSYKVLILWLDRDKAAEAVKFLKQYQGLFSRVKVVITNEDPKDYMDHEIAQKLRSVINDYSSPTFPVIPVIQDHIKQDT